MSSKILTRDKTENTLRAMLETAGLTLDALDLEKAWDVFIEFCKIPIESETDGVIVQWGPAYERDRVSSAGFTFQILRQFDDGYMEFEQLTLEWVYELDAMLESVGYGGSDWCFAEQGCDVEAFIRTEQSNNLFQLLKQRVPYETAIFQENTG